VERTHLIIITALRKGGEKACILRWEQGDCKKGGGIKRLKEGGGYNSWEKPIQIRSIGGFSKTAGENPSGNRVPKKEKKKNPPNKG